MEALIKSWEIGKPLTRFRVPALRKYTYALGGLMLYYGIKLELDRRSDLKEAELKKLRLSMPVYEMKDEDYLNPPWSGHNYEAWKYRLIKCKGRQVHVKAMPIPELVNNYEGFANFLPVIHKEDANLENQVGILVNVGWIPHEYQLMGARMRIEDAFNQREFVGMLNRGEQYSRWNFWKKGNAFDEQRWVWNNFYLPDMAKAVNLKNEKALRQGVIEVLDLESTALDLNDPLHVSRDLSLTRTYPHTKTLAGVLQPNEKYWDMRRKQFFYGLAATALFLY